MRYRMVALAFSVLSPIYATMAQPSTDIVPFPEDAMAAHGKIQPAERGSYTLDTPLEIIAADPAAAAVIDKDVPGLLTDSHYPMIEGLGLKEIAALSGGELTAEMLAQTEADLKSVPVMAGARCKRLRTESNALLGDRRLPVIQTDC